MVCVVHVVCAKLKVDNAVRSQLLDACQPPCPQVLANLL